MVFIILSLKRNFCKEKNLKLTPFCVRFRFSLVTPTGFCPLLRGKQTLFARGLPSVANERTLGFGNPARIAKIKEPIFWLLYFLVLPAGIEPTTAP